MKKGMWIYLTTLIIFLSACAGETDIIDDISLISAVGYDFIDEHQILGTVVVPDFKEDKTVSSIVFSDTTDLIQQHAVTINAEARQPLVIGKIEVILFDEELAKEGIHKYKDIFVRDPSVSTRARLAVVEGSTQDVLTREYWDYDSGMYLSDMFQQNIEAGRMPKSNLHTYTYDLYSEGKDPYLPLLSVGKMVKINKIALFDDDVYVGKLPERLVYAFKALKGEKNLASYSFVDQEGENSAAIRTVSTKRTITFKDEGEELTVEINVELIGNLREYRGDKVDKKILEKIEKSMAKQLERESKEIIQTLQELNIDTLGLGMEYRSKHRGFKIEKWEDMYANATIIPKYSVKIDEIGVRE